MPRTGYVPAALTSRGLDWIQSRGDERSSPEPTRCTTRGGSRPRLARRARSARAGEGARAHARTTGSFRGLVAREARRARHALRRRHDALREARIVGTENRLDPGWT